MLAGVHAHARRADVSLRDVTIARDGKRRLASANDVTHRKRTDEFWEILKKSVSWDKTPEELRWDLPRRKDGWFSLARWVLCGGCHTCWVGWGSDEKASIERLYLSPYVETFNSKVIKVFVPELRSRYVFFEFQDSFYLFGHSMYVSYIAISWLWYTYWITIIYVSNKWNHSIV